MGRGKRGSMGGQDLLVRRSEKKKWSLDLRRKKKGTDR